MIKDRIVGKWREWFGKDSPTPNLSPQDILNIDKTLESRISSYPGLFLDLSSLSFDPKRDWGVRIGNWYIIRKIAGNDYGDSDSDEWDVPNLPPIFGTDWTPDFNKLPTEIPKTTRPPTTTPKIELTTPRQQTTQTITQSDLIFTESTVTPTEAIATSTESIPLPTQLITTSIEPNIEIDSSSEEMITSSETVVMNSVPVAAPTDSTLTSTESTVSSVDTTMFSVTSTSSTDLTSMFKSIETSIESAVSNETDNTSSEELTTTTTNDSPEMSTEQILPFFNKRVEDNETVNKHTTKKPRPASAEVITF
ncbi:PREDICTED: cell wall integrity and stress response component 3-like isoform X3 [Acromyrmex echinatior]|uniref:Zonadhesin n=2 Tax=Acromyrmex echinatior TaxID=103372 RepID=F4WT29_ACREC|nr:PREDICTED: cell wall integrity and stress response component 3-like isoform X3 [Acromyrmex echinatior]XP_011059112.1 PREDICTED: cell wall integrity and stress response component 3-like isoform X3 [Acromyrmex echinatior]EGI62642.1 Zonadhesin [Acromyrmex echinatior]